MAPAEEDSGYIDFNDDESSNEGGTEIVHDVECATFPLGSQEFAEEFKRVLAAVSFEPRIIDSLF